MKVAIDCKNREEAAALKLALGDDVVRAFVTVVGALLALPGDGARRRVLRYVADSLDERVEVEGATPGPKEAQP